MAQNKKEVTTRFVGVGDYRSTPKTEEYISDILKSGRISYGAYSKRFEEEFAALHGCKYGVLSNSGTSSLHIALQALRECNQNIDMGDKVLVPATTFVATPNIILHNNMTPVFVDVDPDTYNIDMSKAKFETGIMAVIPVHLFGYPADMTAVREFATTYNLRIIEDSCETMFVEHNGEKVGSIGDIGCFSMYAAHIIVAGVGGISTTNDPRYAAKMRSLVNHGLTMENLNVDKNFSPQPQTNRRFQFDTAGYSYRITEFEAAVGLAQLSDWKNILSARLKNARHIHAKLRILNSAYENKFKLPEYGFNRGGEHAWMMFPIMYYGNEGKDKLMSYLNHHKIETRDMMPILSQPFYSYLNKEDFPVSWDICQRGFYIGCHQYLDEEDIEYVAQVMRNYLEENHGVQ